jgi:HSP20 family protein
VSQRRQDPLRDLLSLQEKMNRLFEESLSRSATPPAFLDGSAWSPLADVYETSEAYVVQAELPGVGEDEVELLIEADGLLLKGHRRPAGSGRPDCFHRMERSYGPFNRRFDFPEDVEPARAVVQFRDGLLRVEVPKVRPRSPLRPREDDA